MNEELILKQIKAVIDKIGEKKYLQFLKNSLNKEIPFDEELYKKIQDIRNSVTE